MNLLQEFEKQIKNLLKKGYPKLGGIKESEFLDLIEPLRAKLVKLDQHDIDLEKGYLPFVIVVKNKLVPTDKAMAQVEKEGKTGIVKLFPLIPNDFSTIADVNIPDSEIYLLSGIDRGRKNINLPPSEAMKIILKNGRSPLTIDEGVAIITQYPEFLMRNNCFSLLASRHAGDKRVPSMWINANNNPNLGWCWNGNPHTWLGSASCEARIY